MTTYYFHLHHSDGLVEDPGGSELADLEAAIEEAKSGARALVAVSIAKTSCSSRRLSNSLVRRRILVQLHANASDHPQCPCYQEEG